MSLFDTPNADAYRGSHDEGSAAPLMGFMDGLDAAWTAQTKVHSLLAVEQGMRAIEQGQIKKMKEAGLRPHKSLDDSEDLGTGPLGGAQFRQGRYSAAAQAVVDGGGWYTDEMIAERDKQIESVKAERPDLELMTYAEMFAKVREQSIEIEKRAKGPTTLMGDIGSFIGGAAGAMNPVSDPINAATMFVGGGTGALGRVAVQGVAQAGVEAGNMAITPNNENILLGRQPTFGEDMARLGFAVAGGVGGQLIGEAATAGVRRMRTGRWFSDLPEPKPTPEPHDYPRDVYGPWAGDVPPRMEPGRPINDYPDWETFVAAHGGEPTTPYGKTREAALRTALDLDHVTAELQKWDGPAPHEVGPPRTDTAFIPEPERGVAYDKPYQKYVDSLDTVDDIARRIDPDLFRLYDKLAAQRQEIDASIERAKGPDVRPNADRPDVVAEYASWQAATDQQLRLRLQEIDYQMRDLAPLVTRAYGAAEKEWRTSGPNIDTLRFLQKLENETGFRYRGDGKQSLTERPPRIPTKDQPVTPIATTEDKVPLASISDRTESKVKVNANADAADRARANIDEQLTQIDEKVDAFVTQSAKLVDPERPLVTGYTTGRGSTYEVHPDGTTTRTKAARPEHPGDEGIKDRSEMTVYVDPETAREIGMWQTSSASGKRVVVRGDELVLTSKNLTSGAQGRDAFIHSGKFSTEPEAGKSPVELWKKGDGGYAGVHPGNPITELRSEVIMPDGSRLSLDERVPYVDENGVGRDVSVREFLQEMQKDNDALKSVMTCSRPG